MCIYLSGVSYLSVNIVNHYSETSLYVTSFSCDSSLSLCSDILLLNLWTPLLSRPYGPRKPTPSCDSPQHSAASSFKYFKCFQDLFLPSKRQGRVANLENRRNKTPFPGLASLEAEVPTHVCPLSLTKKKCSGHKEWKGKGHRTLGSDLSYANVKRPFIFLFCFVELEIEPGVLCIPGKCSTAELHPKPSSYFLFWNSLVKLSGLALNSHCKPSTF